MRTGENIYKRKDGRWEARYRKGRDADGKLIYGSCYGKTYTEAKSKAVAAQQNLGKENDAIVLNPLSVSALCDEWLELNRIRLKEATYAKYRGAIEKHLKPQFGERKLSDLNSESIRQFGTILIEEKKLLPKTAKDILLILHSVIDYARKKEPDVFSHIDFVYPKETPSELRVLSTAEQSVLTNYLLADIDPCKFGVLLALWTGIRIGELCALRWDHVDLQECCIHIDSTMQRLPDMRVDAPAKTKVVIDTPKSLASVRTIPLNPRATALSRQMRPVDPCSYILTGTGRYMEPRILQYHFGRYAQFCRLDGVHFHTLRHTFATRSIEVGFEIKSLSEILGHANTTITLNRYVHCSMKLKRDNMRKLQAIGM